MQAAEKLNRVTISKTSRWRRACLASALVAAGVLVAAAAAEGATIEGILEVQYGDPRPGATDGTVEWYALALDGGDRLPLSPTADGDPTLARLRELVGRRVRLTTDDGASGSAGVQAVGVPVLGISAVDRSPAGIQGVSGSQPWITIACKFAGNATEPKNLAYFQGLYSSSWPGLDHYWRELSYDTVNVVGSAAVNWVQLPHPSSHYAYQENGTGDWILDLDGLFDDCTAAANSLVYYPDFVGINMMFNATFGPWAWGGGKWATLDGQSRLWRVTWEPPWGYSNQCVLAHEMGHGFGLPHSNNADGDGDPYDNPWDVMSDSWTRALSHSTYGTLGKHTIAYHKDRLGWIPAGQKLEVATAGAHTVVLDHLALQSTSNYRMVRIPVPGSTRFYTVEVRDREGYDGNLAGFAVIVHEVNPGRGEPAWLVDPVDPANGADAGAMWVAGECWEPTDVDVEVCVNHATTDGYSVTVYSGVDRIFSDGFEVGGTAAWSDVEP